MQDQQPANVEICWTTVADDVLYWESWGDQHALFDTRSGETHLLPDMTASLLRQLAVRPYNARILAETLCARTGETLDEQFLGHIMRLLEQLQEMGLIEKTTRDTC